MATKRLDPKVRIASAYGRTKRILRRPSHPFSVHSKPFQIQPFMLAPVLPGETLKNLVFQSRVVTDPIKHPLIGWWAEYFFFYVKHRDIEYHLDPTMVDKPFQDLMLRPGSDLSALAEPANLATYHGAGGVNFTQLCLEVITEWFFRDEGEGWDSATLNGLPLSQITGKSWLDSLTLAENKRTDRRVDLDMDGDGTIQADEVDDAMAHWHALRDAGLTDMDYEDYIRTYGVQIREVETSPNLYRPELLRYSREWSYPTNIVDPATGVPSSAVSWSVSGRADKDRFFKEPGFLIGVNVVRPKVYSSQNKGSLAHWLDNVHAWLPAITQQHYEQAFKHFADDEGPLADLLADEGGYWVDLRDLYTHGDQFVNHAVTDGMLPYISPDGGRRYVDATAISSLFKDSEKTAVRQDGIVNLGIAGRQRDMTPGPVL